ncbi:LAMI_0E14290g1_1 [Lachancea mirantina]|uniref:LAMI_0E14290g1_1 n=1 Tax=Lachancea mirantina TaxID=1230905 RepID=A0A1G4JRV5_9SACH|nr:LAMI_0E14290g1_1 [Lachancea mirantina]
MLIHSQSMKSGLSAHLLQSYDEHTSHHHNVQYIIASEFDNKLGPVVKFQYPKSIPGFKTNFNSIGTNLASLMIPNSIESKPGDTDFTVFILYKTRKHAYSIYPIESQEVSEGNSWSSTIIEEREQELSGDDDDAVAAGSDEDFGLSTSDDSPLFFFNIASSVRDTTNKRGARIKSIGMGTKMSNFLILKPILVMLLHEYLRLPNGGTSMLVECFNMINSLDLSTVRHIHGDQCLQAVLSSIGDEDAVKTLLDPSSESLRKIIGLNILPESDQFGNKIRFKSKNIEYQFNIFQTSDLPNYFTKIPLQIDLITYDPIPVEIRYNDLVLKFVARFLQKMYRCKQSSMSWRLVVNCCKLPKDTLCQFVIALSNLMRGFDRRDRKGPQLFVFPYMDISFIDSLRAAMKRVKSSHSTSIIGVSNPIFEIQEDIWDYYYDLDEDRLVNKHLLGSEPLTKNPAGFRKSRPKSLKVQKLWTRDFGDSHESHAEHNIQMTSRLSLELVKYQHDNETIINVFKRKTILQILSLLKRAAQRPSQHYEYSLKEEYLVAYHDFVLFPEFFEPNSLNMIKLLFDLEQCLAFLLTNEHSKLENIQNTLNQILSSIMEMYRYVTCNVASMNTFLNVCLNYPPTQLVDIMTQADFSELDLKLCAERAQTLSGLSIEKSQDLVLWFTRDYFTNLLYCPLFLNDRIAEDHFSRGYDVPLSSALSDSNSFFSGTGDTRYDTVATGDPTMLVSSLNIGAFDDSLAADISKLVNQIKEHCIALIRAIESNSVGSQLLEKRVNLAFKLVTRHFTEPKHDQATCVPSHRRDAQFPINENNFEISPNRRELLNNLNTLAEAQGKLALRGSTGTEFSRPTFF